MVHYLCNLRTPGSEDTGPLSNDNVDTIIGIIIIIIINSMSLQGFLLYEIHWDCLWKEKAEYDASGVKVEI